MTREDRRGISGLGDSGKLRVSRGKRSLSSLSRGHEAKRLGLRYATPAQKACAPIRATSRPGAFAHLGLGTMAATK